MIAEGAATAHDYCEINYFISVLLLMSFNGTVEHFYLLKIEYYKGRLPSAIPKLKLIY